MDPHNLTRAQVIALMEERDTLKEALRQMEQAMAPVMQLPREWRLTGCETKFLFAVRAVAPNVAHKERVLIAMYGVLDQDMPDQKVIDVYACKVRRKLMAVQAQIHIETVWGRGYRLSPESLARLDTAIESTRAPTTWPAGVPLLVAAE